jgi:succinate dehydrogenase/fumarate reductase cytochrome b subunit
MKTLIIVAFLALIAYNLFAGLYYMLTDKGTSKRTVNALTKRIVLSIILILGICVGIGAGYIEPHGVNVG